MDSPQTPPVGVETGSRIGVRFYRYRAILRRYWWIIAATVALGLLYQGWVLFNKKERFISVGKLKVQEMGGGSAERFTVDPSWYITISKTIESPVVLDLANKRASMLKPEFDGLRDSVAIKAENEQNSYFFSVTGSGTTRDYTKFYVATVMDAFMEKRREESKEGLRGKSEHLLQNLERERNAVTQAQTDVDKFKADNGVLFFEDERERIITEITETKKERDRLQQEITTLKNMTQGKLLKGETKPGEKEQANNDWVETQKQLAAKEDELQERSVVWKPAHPGFETLQSDIRRLKLSLSVLRKEAEEGRRSDLARLEAELDTKTKALAERETHAKEFDKTAARYDSLNKELLRREAQVEHTRKLLDDAITTGAGVEILAIAQTASDAYPEARNYLKHLLTGLIGGLLIGLVILFLLDRADDRLASSSEMIEQFNEPILGQIPDVATSRTEQGLPLLQDDDDRFMYAEALRSLRSSLIFMPNQAELKTLIITSAIPNEGKSTIASNLAITMSNAGARVLLVDADLRRGDIATLFDTDGRQGLSNVLRGEVEWKNAVQPLRGDKLHIIPRGPVTNQSGELLLLPIVSKLLEEWKTAYDLVIFNTAPILATDDTPTLAPNFDGTLMVIRASFTSARLTRNALNVLYQRQVNVLGLILNCVDTELPDYYYYRYPKYYSV